MSGRSQVEAARISAAVTTERKRIERDLHDGAQQKLVNAALSLELARDQLDGAANGAIGELLGASKEMLQSALADLRDLSRGIYPALLSEYGLVPAVESLVRSNTLPVEFNFEPIPRLPEQTEIAAYFVIAEALTNVLKHARASQVRIGMGYYGDALDVSVSDDGVGGVDESAGSGIRGLRGRVVAVGGTLRVDSRPGEGTALSATFPAAREPS
jgi:signal transduction histidine kinase